MRYLLDTNICVYLINRKPQYEAVLRHMDGLAYNDILISAITIAELRYGVANSTKPEQNREKFESFIERFDIVDFDDAAAAAYGRIRTELKNAGTPIGPLDTLIAAHAASLKCTLVTNNVREFERVPGLKIENWTQ